MRMKTTRILYLQLPCLDNGSGRDMENMPMAASYLHHALTRSGEEKGRLETRFLSREEEMLDDRHLLQLLIAWRPDILCSTLYLWNVERSIHILREVKRALPGLRVVAGGPEVGFDHPFLFRSLVPDCAVVGEGEAVFPLIVRALRRGDATDFQTVAWRDGRRYLWGKKPAASLPLARILPPPGSPAWGPDANGIAYMETGRGCPMSCTYCRYSHLRRKMSFLSAQEVTRRVKSLKEKGAREIRFVDPTLNANPSFGRILSSLAEMGDSKRPVLFAELRAETLQPEEIGLLAPSGLRSVEVGVQSRDPQVLRSIHRPTNQERLEESLRRMISEGIEVTLDLMYGLPGQSLGEVEDSIRWARGLKPAYVQCLQTLLLPGTELRRERRRWSIRADTLPPYGVRSTNGLSWEEILKIEKIIHEISPTNSMTVRFVGYRIPDLFEEKVTLDVELTQIPAVVPGSSSRRAILIRGQDLYAAKRRILSILRRAVMGEPHMLWQFVLNPAGEFPLDLLEEMIGEIRSFPSHWIDRFASVSGWNRIASRRIFILLRRGRPCPPDWILGAQTLLEDHFY